MVIQILELDLVSMQEFTWSYINGWACVCRYFWKRWQLSTLLENNKRVESMSWIKQYAPEKYEVIFQVEDALSETKPTEATKPLMILMYLP